MTDFDRWFAGLSPASEQVPQPDRLRLLPDCDWLGDHDMRAWELVLESRGGCRCHLYPPCYACSEPITCDELEMVGFAYEERTHGIGGKP